LTFEQWLGLLDCLKRRVPPYKQMRLQIERPRLPFEK